MPRDGETDILEREKFYCLREDGPWVHKKYGNGKVLRRLLSLNGRSMSLDTAGRLSGWQNPRRNMERLATMINAWSANHQIQISQSRGVTYYRMPRVR